MKRWKLNVLRRRRKRWRKGILGGTQEESNEDHDDDQEREEDEEDENQEGGEGFRGERMDGSEHGDNINDTHDDRATDKEQQDTQHNTDKGKQQSYDDDHGITWLFSSPSRKMATWNCRFKLVLAVIAIIWRRWHRICDNSRANEGLSRNLAWRHHLAEMAHFPCRTWSHTEKLVAKQHQLIMCRCVVAKLD